MTNQLTAWTGLLVLLSCLVTLSVRKCPSAILIMSVDISIGKTRPIAYEAEGPPSALDLVYTAFGLL